MHNYFNQPAQHLNAVVNYPTTFDYIFPLYISAKTFYQQEIKSQKVNIFLIFFLLVSPN